MPFTPTVNLSRDTATSSATKLESYITTVNYSVNLNASSNDTYTTPGHHLATTSRPRNGMLGHVLDLVPALKVIMWGERVTPHSRNLTSLSLWFHEDEMGGERIQCFCLIHILLTSKTIWHYEIMNECYILPYGVPRLLREESKENIV